MHSNLRTTVAFLAFSASPLLAQTARIATANTDPNALGGGDGAAVVALGDWVGSTTPDYAVSAPVDTTGGPQAGLIRIYDGATGLVARTVTGVGFATSCSGGPVGDLLGERMTTIDDCDGDGRREILASRRLAPLNVGGCQQIGHGGFTIIFSNPATPNFNFTAPTQLGLGVAVAGIAPSGSLAQFVVSTSVGDAQVWRRSSTSVNPVQVANITGFGQTGTALCSAGTVGGVAAFAVNGPGQVLIKNINGTTLQTISGPLFTGFGSSLAFFPDPVGGDGIVIGEPAFNITPGGNEGSSHLASIAGGVIVQTTFGAAPGDRLGQVVAAGGDINADGNPDYLASTVSGNQALIINRNGVQTARMIVLPTTATPIAAMRSMAVSADMTSDGFVDVIFGGTFQGDRSWVYFGGPEANVTVVGFPTSQSSALPTLGINAFPVVGTAPTFGLFGSTPGSFSALLGGVSDPIGTTIPGTNLILFLLTTPAPITGFSTLTDASGNWIGNPVPIPRLLGAQFGFQGVTIANIPNNPLEFTNGLNLTIGW